MIGAVSVLVTDCASSKPFRLSVIDCTSIVHNAGRPRQEVKRLVGHLGIEEQEGTVYEPDRAPIYPVSIWLVVL